MFFHILFFTISHIHPDNDLEPCSKSETSPLVQSSKNMEHIVQQAPSMLRIILSLTVFTMKPFYQTSTPHQHCSLQWSHTRIALTLRNERDSVGKRKIRNRGR